MVLQSFVIIVLAKFFLLKVRVIDSVILGLLPPLFGELFITVHFFECESVYV